MSMTRMLRSASCLFALVWAVLDSASSFADDSGIELRTTADGYELVRTSDGAVLAWSDALTVDSYAYQDANTGQRALLVRTGWENGWDFFLFHLHENAIDRQLTASGMEAIFVANDFDGDGRIDFLFFQSQQEFSSRIEQHLLPRIYYARDEGFEVGGWPCGSVGAHLARSALAGAIDRGAGASTGDRFLAGELAYLREHLDQMDGDCGD